MRRIMFILNLAQGNYVVSHKWNRPGGAAGEGGGGGEEPVEKPLYRHLIPNSSVIVWRLQSLASQLQ